MRVLVTGVAGFIGTNLAEALLVRGDEVIGLDNLSQGRQDNMARLVQHPNFHFYEGDVRYRDDVFEASQGVDAIVHLAAYKIPRYEDAYDTLMINALGAENTAQAALATGSKLVAASTSDVYGKNSELPFHEESDLVIGSPYVRRWAYAISKMFEEQLLFAYHERHLVDIVLLRFFGGYGPYQNLTWWGGPQSVFINCALDQQPIPIHGDGQQTRTFTYVSDHVNGIMRAIDQPAANNHVFNIGGTQEITIENLARLIWQLVRGDEGALIDFIPYETMGRYEDVRRRVPDISKAHELLGFIPEVTLEEGMKKTIQWQVGYRRQQGIETPTPYFERLR